MTAHIFVKVFKISLIKFVGPSLFEFHAFKVFEIRFHSSTRSAISGGKMGLPFPQYWLLSITLIPPIIWDKIWARIAQKFCPEVVISKTVGTILCFLCIEMQAKLHVKPNYYQSFANFKQKCNKTQK